MNEEKLYRDGILEMLSAIHNTEWLKKIYSFIRVFASDKEDVV